MLIVEDQRVQFPLVLIFINAGVFDSEPTIVLRIGFVVPTSLGRWCCYGTRVASEANCAYNDRLRNPFFQHLLLCYYLSLESDHTAFLLNRLKDALQDPLVVSSNVFVLIVIVAGEGG